MSILFVAFMRIVIFRMFFKCFIPVQILLVVDYLSVKDVCFFFSFFKDVDFDGKFFRSLVFERSLCSYPRLEDKDVVRAQFNKRLKETLRARISSVIFQFFLAKIRKLTWH